MKHIEQPRCPTHDEGNAVMSPGEPSRKVFPDPQDLVSVLEAHRRAGRRIVFTNGVFDLLHVGHIRCLRAARNQGDLLVVAINSDEYVARKKMPEGPVNPAADRMELLAGFACVDYVTCFHEDTACSLLHLLRPDIHAKGTDYSATTLPERNTNNQLGIKMAFVGDEKGHSSTVLRSHISHAEPPNRDPLL